MKKKIEEIAINSIVEKNGVRFKVIARLLNRTIVKPLDNDFVMAVKPSVRFEVKEGF